MTHSGVAETRMCQGDDCCRVSRELGKANVELYWPDSIEVLEAPAFGPWRELRSELADQRRDVDTKRQNQARLLLSELLAKKRETIVDKSRIGGPRKRSSGGTARTQSEIDIREEAIDRINGDLSQQLEQLSPRRLRLGLARARERLEISGFGMKVVSEDHHSANGEGRKWLSDVGTPEAIAARKERDPWDGRRYGKNAWRQIKWRVMALPKQLRRMHVMSRSRLRN